MFSEWVFLLLRASFLLSLGSCLVICLSRWQPLVNPRWYRAAWTCVLFQGLLLVPSPIVISLGWLNLPGSQLGIAANDPSVIAAVSSELLPSELLPSNALPSNALPSNALPSELASMDRSLSIAGRQLEGMFDRASVGQLGVSYSNATSSANALNTDETNALFAAPPKRSPLSADNQAQQQDLQDMAVIASNLFQTLQIIWLIGFLVWLGWFVIQYVMFLLALRSSRLARPSWCEELRELQIELEIKQSLPLLVHSTLGPLLCRRPTGACVVVPVRLWNQLSAAERKAVLHHELCHWRRGDLWKSTAARFVVILHWFNPLAWVAARRFEESAEWSCDSMLAAEAPSRVSQLATALIHAIGINDGVPHGACAVTGGPVFQRIRRLLTAYQSGDSWMQKTVWIIAVMLVVGLAIVRPQFGPSESSALATEVGLAADDDSTDQQPAENAERLNEFLGRIVVADGNDELKRFIAVAQTPTGKLLLADQFAVQAQQALEDVDAGSAWEQFQATYFEEAAEGGKLRVKPEHQAQLDRFVRLVEQGSRDIAEIEKTFKLVADNIIGDEETASMFKRFLSHEGAAAYVYYEDLQARLRPTASDVANELEEILVRAKGGQFVIRPARRNYVVQRLEFAKKLHPVLERLQAELKDWASEVIASDDEERRIVATLAGPYFAEYAAVELVSSEADDPDQELEHIFWVLESATEDTAKGLVFKKDTEEYVDIKRQVERLIGLSSNRERLLGPLQQLSEQIPETDELHLQLKKFLATDLAFASVVREMEYINLTPALAAKQRLSNWLTENEEGKYEITVESNEELTQSLQEYFSGYRETRRRGRIIDDFASKLPAGGLQTSLQSMFGKLKLRDLLAETVDEPNIDGMQYWIDQHFEETSEGLVLHDWARPMIEDFLREAAEMQDNLVETDF